MSRSLARGISFGILMAVALCGLGPSYALIPPKSGVAAPPVALSEPTRGFDPTWANHRGQVILVLYVGKNSEVPVETLQRINDWQERMGPQGLQVVVLTENTPPAGLHPRIIAAKDAKGETRKRYGITEPREYFVVDRYGRLRRQKVSEALIEKALSERFDPSWVGYSGAWNQTYFVFQGDTLFYLADTLPDAVTPGEAFDVRLIALPTYSVARPGAEIHSPIQVEVRADSGFEQDVYKAELREAVQVSTEMLLQVKARKDIEPGLHILWVNTRHQHCGFGRCGGYEQTIPVPIWVE